MKKHKKTLTVIIIAVVALIMFTGFYGIKVKNGEGEFKNIIPNLKLGMEFGEKRVITATLDTETTTKIYDAEGNVVEPEEGKEYTEEEGYKTEEEKVNPDSVRTLSNYKKTKSILEERLKNNNIPEYFIALDELTGKIKVEIPENEKADEIKDMLKNSGSFMLLDGETFEVAMDSSHLKKANVMFSQGNLESAVILQLEFDEEGTKKLQELNEIYVETTKEIETEDGQTESTVESKTAWVILNDAFVGQTVLPNIVYDNKVMLTLGYSSDINELQAAQENAISAAILLNSGTPPVVYDFTDEVQQTKITDNVLLIFGATIGLVFVIVYVIMIVKFKAKGFIAAYFQIGYLATLLLVLKLTNVTVTMEGMAGIVISMILEYIFTYIVLTNVKNKKDGMYKKSNLEFFFDTLPIYAVAVVFTFATRANVNSFGMTLFWGIILTYVYNFIFSKFIFENLKKEAKNENN